MASDLVVVDLSHWNPTPNWVALKSAGVVGVIHKATEGTGSADGTLFDRAADAMAAGLKWSTYHFLRPGNMKQQMDFYLKTINPVDGERVCLDHEDSGVSLADLEDAVEYLQADPRNLQVCIYSGNVIKEQLGNGYSEVLATTSLWLAQYTSGTPSWPARTWAAWTLWQYTDKANVVGISQPVDGDRFNGSVEQCLAWFGPAGSEPAPGPEPEPDEEPEVVVDITATDGVKVTVLVNGDPR